MATVQFDLNTAVHAIKVESAKKSILVRNNAKNVGKLILEKKESHLLTHKKSNLTKRVTNLTFQLQYKSAKKVKCRSVS